MPKVTQLFFILGISDPEIGELELHPKPKPKGVKVSGKHRDKINLLALLDLREGNRESWGRFVYHVLIEVRDWRNGVYTAVCGCSFEYKGGNVYPNKVCDTHPSIWKADFQSDEEILITAKVKEAKAWYFQLPEARVAAQAWDQFGRWGLIPENFGYRKPKDWLGRVVTIDTGYGPSCGCSFKFQAYDVDGVPWRTRKSRIILMVKYGSCGNHNNSCKRAQLPIGVRASKEINRIISQHRVV